MKNLKRLSLAITVLLSSLCLFGLSASVVFADNPPADCVGGDNSQCAGGPSGNTAPTTTNPQADPNCNNSSDAGINKCLKNNQIVKDLNAIVDFLAAGVGIVVIATIIVGGIQYSLAGDNATATGAAKQRITNGLIALATFIFAFALLQWLIPGGL